MIDAPPAQAPAAAASTPRRGAPPAARDGGSGGVLAWGGWGIWRAVRLPPLHLPPLPPVAGSLSGRSVVDVLAEEHRELLALLGAGAGSARRRRDLLDVLAASASRHLCAERQYLYPAVRAALPDGAALAAREVAAGHEILISLRDRADVAGALRRHVDATAALLDRLAGAVTVEDLVRLGSRVEVAEEAAPTRPHPGAPATPPWNKVVDPALGTLDRLRDAVTGRPTSAKMLTRRYANRLF
ncbi:hemerythrin domain-containing protein [Phytohabitans rumicis]|uniref:hemerythrin domain-containing protein n=1 Tax=Phytohabitans rumicis TaxID=1076125 RepID=UPI0031E64F50